MRQHKYASTEVQQFLIDSNQPLNSVYITTIENVLILVKHI